MISEAPILISNVRWLAEECGIESIRLPLPVLVSAQFRGGIIAHQPRHLFQQASQHRKSLYHYLRWWLKHPDQGSNFEKKTRYLRWLPLGIVLRLMKRRAYDGLLYLRGEEVLGHLFYQRNGGDLCAFSLAMIPELQGSLLSTVVTLDFLGYAFALPNITRANVGSGRNRVTQRSWTVLKSHEDKLPLQVDAGGWIHFRR